MSYMVWLLVENASFAAGAAVDDIVFRMIPWVVGLTGFGGIVFALLVRRYAPRRYQMLGRVVLDVRERRELNANELPRVRHRR
jgi:hypothetical protein